MPSLTRRPGRPAPSPAAPGTRRPASAIAAAPAAVVGMLVAIAVLAAGCTTVTPGRGAPAPVDPDVVAGIAVEGGPNGLRPDGPASGLTVDGAVGDRMDLLAEATLADLHSYWSDAFPAAFHRRLAPVDRFVSWDSSTKDGSGPLFCGGPTAGIANAGYCRSRNEIGWDRGPLMTGLVTDYGDLAPVVVLAHEYGHVLQYQTGRDTVNEPTIVLEQQADCYAGVFLRHVAEGGAARIAMNTADGLDTAMAVLVGIRDSPDGDVFGGAEHGSAFERVTAFQRGFSEDAGACSRIDAADVDARRGNIPLNAFIHAGGPPRAVDPDSMAAAAASLSQTFALDPPPVLATAPAAADCTDPPPTAPARYCPDTDRVAADPAGLAAATQPSGDGAAITGRFTAFGMLASRYALAAAQRRGSPLTGDVAAARTACLTGSWIRHLADADERSDAPDAGGAHGELRLRPGDVDDVVSSLLTGGLAGADLNGATGPSAFARVDAFRRGFDTPHACFRFYP